MFLFHTNLYAALIALACAALSADTFSLQVGYKFYAFIFFAALFVYNFDRLKKKSVSDRMNSPERMSFVNRYKKSVLILTSFSFLGGVIFFLHLNVPAMLVAAFTGAVTISYFLLPGEKNKKKSWIRGILKPVFLSLAWSVTTVILPFVFAEQKIESRAVLFFLSFFILFLVIGLWFDFKDRKGDMLEGKNNLANLLSQKNYLILIFVLIAFNLIFTSTVVKSLPLIMLSAYYLFHSIFYRELKILDGGDEKNYLLFIDLPIFLVPAATQAGKIPWSSFF